MAATEPVLELENITKRYAAHVALDDVSLVIGPGVTGLLGPNGCGKSTLIKSVLGLLKIQSGRATVLGYRLPQELRTIRDHVGYLPEDDCFVPGIAGIESVNFMARLSGLPSIEALRRSHEALDYADIGQERYRMVETYSTGMRQKLKFAQAIVHDPQLLILDEPTSGLDPDQRVAILRKIKNLALEHDKSVLICTHILHDVKTVCDWVVIMSEGRIKLTDSLENLSRPARSGMLVRLEQTLGERQPAGADAYAAELRRAGLDCEVRSDQSIWVHEVDGKSCSPLWAAAERCGARIHHLSPARNSLEEVFVSAVREARHAAV